jgi:hypothetical protein
MFLAPFFLFSIWGSARPPLWIFLVVFIPAMAGAVLYFFGADGTFFSIEPIMGVAHKYSKLLVTCVAILVTGCRAFWLGLITGKARP